MIRRVKLSRIICNTRHIKRFEISGHNEIKTTSVNHVPISLASAAIGGLLSLPKTAARIGATS
jgi:hypothetical protein